MKNDLLITTINKCHPNVKTLLERLFEEFGTLDNILGHAEASNLYCRLMAHVVYQREIELGAKFNYNTWNFDVRPYEELREIYKNTIVMPF